QKLLQDQYEREFGGVVQVVKGRDNYACERYPDARVPTSLGMCRRPRGPLCQCPYARAKAAALSGPVFCANTWYFATLRHWHAEQLPRRRLLIVDEAHNLEGQLVSVYAVRFTAPEMKEWFGGALARLRAFVEGESTEWVVRYAPEPGATLELTPLGVAVEARALLTECAEITVLLSAYLGPATAVAETLGFEADDARAFATPSPFPLEQRPIVYRPVGALSRATLPALEPALFAEIVSILGAHPRDKGLIHVASYAVARRLMADLARRAPAEARRLIFAESSDAKAAALE